MLYLLQSVVFSVRVGGNEMRIGREELEELRGKLEQLTEFIRDMEKGELPYFYHCFDTMKNNIEIYFCVGNDDIDDFMPVLERDWNASHRMFIGVQNYDIMENHPGIDPTVPLYFAGLLAGIGRYFESGRK